MLRIANRRLECLLQREVCLRLCECSRTEITRFSRRALSLVETSTIGVHATAMNLVLQHQDGPIRAHPKISTHRERPRVREAATTTTNGEIVLSLLDSRKSGLQRLLGQRKDVRIVLATRPEIPEKEAATARDDPKLPGDRILVLHQLPGTNHGHQRKATHPELSTTAEAATPVPVDAQVSSRVQGPTTSYTDKYHARRAQTRQAPNPSH